MPYVKLDCGTLDSSLWIDREAREIFITALLMATPCEFTTPKVEILTGKNCIEETGFIVPPGWYGLVRAAGEAIVRRALLPYTKDQQFALIRLSLPDLGSRSREFEGRRMVRINDGYVILNYDKYRERDYSAADRARRYRERKRHAVASRLPVAEPPNVTQAEAVSTSIAKAVLPPSSQLPDCSSATERLSAQLAVAPPTPAAAKAGKGNGREKKAKRSAVTHFVPSEFEVRDEDASWALREHGTLDLYAETQKFRDHEFAVPHSDWHKAWRNWIRRAHEQRR